MKIVSELILGEKVIHDKWMEGDVIEVNDGYLKVDFLCGTKIFQFPQAFDKYLKLVNVEDYYRKYYQYANLSIVEEIRRRNLFYYVHFTNVKNIESILENGLTPVAKLKQNHATYYFNDKDRLDNRTDANSLSITFPNYQMFFRYRTLFPDEKWAVIFFDAKKVAGMNCGYFVHNAASYENRNESWERFTGLSSFISLFEGEREGLYPYEPTDPQAEVMVMDTIPVKYIKKICFEDNGSFKEFLNMNSKISMSVNREYFKPRRDYQRWGKNHG